jgi:hypothetical protein
LVQSAWRRSLGDGYSNADDQIVDLPHRESVDEALHVVNMQQGQKRYSDMNPKLFARRARDVSIETDNESRKAQADVECYLR